MVVRDSRRRRRNSKTGIRVLFFGELYSALDLANGIEVFSYAVPVGRPESSFEMPHLIHRGVEDAALLLDSLQSLLCIGAIAEQAIEHHSRIDFHWQRRCRRAPRDRVHIGAAETHVTRANQSTE